jgi:hypothetical protein
MARQYAVSQIVPSGIAPTLGAASATGDTIITGDSIFLEVNNAGGSTDTVTITAPAAKVCSFGYAGTVHVLTAAVAAGTRARIGPITSIYGDPVTGLASVVHSFITSVTCDGFLF